MYLFGNELQILVLVDVLIGLPKDRVEGLPAGTMEIGIVS